MNLQLVDRFIQKYLQALLKSTKNIYRFKKTAKISN